MGRVNQMKCEEVSEGWRKPVGLPEFLFAVRNLGVVQLALLQK